MTFVAIEPRRIILKARTKKRVSPSYHQQSALAKQMQSSVQLNIFKGLKTFRKRVSPEAVQDAFKTGDYTKILKTIPFEKLPEDLAAGIKGVGNVFGKASKMSIEKLPAPDRRELRYDVSNPFIERYIAKRTGSMIVRIDKDVRENVRSAVERSFTDALTPRQVADLLVQTLPLDPRSSMAVKKYFHGQIRDKVREDRALFNTNNIADRYIDQRAMTIARTEIRNATNFGQLEVWKAGADQGFFDRRIAMKTWIVDGAPCEICEPMDGVSVPLDSVWQLNNGDVVDVPSESHPNCFCGMELEFGEASDEA